MNRYFSMMIYMTVAMTLGLKVAPLKAGSLVASLDPLSGQVGDEFHLTLSINGQQKGDPQIPQIPGLQIAGTGTSQSMSWINGKFDKKVEFGFTIVAEKEGSFTIPPIELEIDGKLERSQAITFNVSSSPQAQPSVKDNPPIFIERKFSHTSAFVHEPIIVTIDIYHRVELLNAEPKNALPATVQAYDAEKQQSQVQLGASRYNKITLTQILEPMKPGKLEIPPFQLDATILVPSSGQRRLGDPFEFFNQMRGKKERKRLQAPAQVIEIKAVPQQNQPQNFSGLVGQFSMEGELSPAKIKAGETATLTVKLSGWGALQGYQFPKPQLAADVKIYQDKPEVSTEARLPDGLFSTATYKFALVPTKSGKLDLGKITASVFNPIAAQYEYLQASVAVLEVEGSVDSDALATQGASSAAATASAEQSTAANNSRGDSAGNETNAGNELRPIERSLSQLQATHSAGAFYRQSFMLPLWFGLVIVALLMLQKLRKSVEGKTAGSARYRAAVKQLNHTLSEATRSTNLEAMAKSFWQFLQTALQASSGKLTKSDIVKLCQAQNAPSELVSQLSQLIDELDSISYGQKHLDGTQLQQMQARMNQLARGLEVICK